MIDECPCSKCLNNGKECTDCAIESSYSVEFPRFKPSSMARKVAEQVEAIQLNRNSEAMK